MTQKKIIHLVMAARPNMMKIAPLYHACLATNWIEPVLVHTGQHYDDNMSGAFLRDFGLPAPHQHLSVGSGSHAEQTGGTMIAYEKLCDLQRPDMTLVVGDVNATIACAITAKKMHIPVGHMEAGLRSFDRSMPEEINRLATDAISDYFWTPSPDATAQLIKENVAAEKIVEVGNIMIDSYCLVEKQIAADTTRQDMGLAPQTYAVMTFHRAGNVDDAAVLNDIITNIENAAQQLPIVFPVHPRTRKKLQDAKLWGRMLANKNIHLLEPQPYTKFMNLVSAARVVVTDSGGVQEETSYLGIPCLTARTTTERPITLTQGTNKLCDFVNINAELSETLKKPMPNRPQIKGWDGKTAARTVAHLTEIFGV